MTTDTFLRRKLSRLHKKRHNSACGCSNYMFPKKQGKQEQAVDLKGLSMIFPGQENPFIIFRSKEIYIYPKINNKIPIYLLR